MDSILATATKSGRLASYRINSNTSELTPLETYSVDKGPPSLRLRADAAKRYKRVDRATAVIWKLLMVAGGRFRRLNWPDLLPGVYVEHSEVKLETEREQMLEEVAA